MNRMLHKLSLAGALVLGTSLAFAQQPAERTGAPAASRGDCVDLSSGPREGTAGEMNDALAPGDTARAQAEDGPAGATSGTSPEDAGSSGWTGGTGGSDIGTSQTEAVDSSPQQNHPAVATGLDPISGETAVTGPQAPAVAAGDSPAQEKAADC